MNSTNVNLEEIFLIKDDGFTSHELLSLLISITDFLIQNSQQKGLFSPKSVYLTQNGNVLIQFLRLEEIEQNFIPPELQQIGSSNADIKDPQMVWCAGQIASKASLPSFSDVNIFSLINLMTVDIVTSRPSPNKLLQMLRNRIDDIDDVPRTMANIYRELMGDIDELKNNPFYGDDDYNETLSKKSSNATDVPEDFPDRAHINNNNIKHLPITQLNHKKTDSNLGLVNLSFEDYPIPNTNSNEKFDNVHLKKVQGLLLLKEFIFLADVHEYHPPNMHSQEIPEKIVSARHFVKRNVDSPVSSPKIKLHHTMDETRNSNVSDEIEPFEQITLPSEIDPNYVRNQQIKQNLPPINPTSQNFSRQNSLQPAKIHRKNSNSSRNLNLGPENSKPFSASTSSSSLFATPEFLDKANMPFIRLRAQSMKRKKVVSLHRSPENAVVLVKLLNGQNVEVKCRTNAYASDIFETVAAHLNLTEHLFFGLALIKNTECYFLENDERLEKSAPSGWKHFSKKTSGNEFCLQLRTENTTHNLYLQLRQDMLDGSIRFEPGKAFDLAAIALQAEFLDRKTIPSLNNNMDASVQYFKLENYLPSKFYAYENENPTNTSTRLADLHAKYSGLHRAEAERMFIQRCQTELGYGAHYYKVYKMKPSSKNPYYNRYSDAHLIAIMPYGIGICREQNGGQQRIIYATHEWHMIRTLQFDKKRFLIATIENNIAVDHVFYTEHYSKSAYLVKFAATQHRFMMKMRHWQSTLNRVKNSGQDVGVDRENNEQLVDSNHYNDNTQKTEITNLDVPDTNFRNSRALSEIDTDYIAYCYGSEAMKLSVTLEKHPENGLGLTLVDGSVNEVKGVYVKSGLNIGDCLLSVNGVSLFNKTRHDAVQLVQRCEREVHLEILRFPSITEVLAQDLQEPSKQSDDKKLIENNNKTKQEKKLSINNGEISDIKSSRKTSNASFALEKRKSSDLGSRKLQVQPQNQRYQRAVSDFGTIGDTLPVLNSDDMLITALGKDVIKHNQDSSSSSEEEQDENEYEDNFKREKDIIKRGEYNLPDVSAMYNIDDDDEEYQTNLADSSISKTKQDGRLYTQHKSTGGGNIMSDKEYDTMSWNSSHYSVKTAFETTTLNSQQSKQKQRQQNNLDWTNELSDIEDGQQTPPPSNNPRNTSIITKNFSVTIRRMASGQSLGFQIATTTVDNIGLVIVKQITAEPALSANLKVNDIILAVCIFYFISKFFKINGISISGYTHQEVVNLLKTQQFNVVLDVQRRESINRNDEDVECDEQIITVELDKSQCPTIGLSLAKRTGQEGIFIRNIAPNSLADQEGTLKVGDRIWELNEENVADENPSSIVNRLKLIDDKFTVCVKRIKKRTTSN